MEHAKELDCPVIIHCESGSLETNRYLSETARSVGLDPGLVVKHFSPPLVLPDETFGVMPSIPASKSYLAEAIGKGARRFMMETDYIDDPDKPGAVMSINTVPKKVHSMLASGKMSEEFVYHICKELPDSLYHR
jgi:TatD-related deoxyribonuclease